MCADDLGQVDALDLAAGEAGVTMPVYVEVNMGGNRCGVEPGEPALGLARQRRRQAASEVCRAPGLSRLGPAPARLEERRAAIAQAADKAGTPAIFSRRHGIACPVVTGAGTGTFEFESGAASTPNCNAAPTSSWTPITAAISTRWRADQGVRAQPVRLGHGDEPPRQERAIVDAGLKALAFDSGPPLVWGSPPPPTSAPPTNMAGSPSPPATNRLHSATRSPGPRPLRPDRQPLRLVCLHPPRPRRSALADHRPRCCI